MSESITSKIQSAPAFLNNDGKSHHTMDLAIAWQRELDNMELKNGMNLVLDQLIPTCMENGFINEIRLRAGLWEFRHAFRAILEQFDK